MTRLAPPPTSALRLAGVLLLMAGAIVLMGIITAEALYPAPYTTGGNEISDLGGTRPPEGLVLQPSATIFNLVMLGCGLLVLVAAWLVQRGLGRRSLAITLGLLGVGAAGVGLFPGNTGTPHALFSLLTFVAGGVCGLVAARVTSAPFRHVSAALGVVSLGALLSYGVLGDAGPLAPLGDGGVERWVAYPVVLWLVGFGGYLTASGAPATEAR
jgi:hypothetical membrane protein